MIQKSIDKIEREDIEALITDEVREGRTIEYKQSLPGGKDLEKKEFLADVSSFANAAGGDLLFGVEEKRDEKNNPLAVPESAPGLCIPNDDEVTKRLDNIIRAGIAPRLTGVQLRVITGFPSGGVLLIRIPKSYAAPHMVVFQESSRFYSRNSSGKYPLDVGEIRSAFALSESFGERVRNFRQEHLARIIADETPVPLQSGPRIVVHLLPIASLDRGTSLDSRSMEQALSALTTLEGTYNDRRFNFDGMIAFAKPDGQACLEYTQLFRQGMIEAVDAYTLQGMSGEKLLPAEYLEEFLIGGVEKYVQLLRRLNFAPPIFIMMTLIGIQGYRIPAQFARFHHSVDRNVVPLPDSLLENYDGSVAELLKAAFDTLWQAAGRPRSPHYDEQGKRKA